MYSQYLAPQWENPGRPQFSSQESYFESTLRPQDAQGYSAAGLLLYRKTSAGGIEALVGVERPWNPLINDYDPLAWNILGGKRAAGKGKEWSPYATVVRNILDIAGAVEGMPSASDLKRMCQNAPAVWYPRGKYALYLSEVPPSQYDMLPERFVEGKAKGLVPAPQDEQRIGSDGRATTKWVKEIEELEWVPLADLLKPVGDTRKPVTNLVENICLVGGFRKFAAEGVLPSNAQPRPISDNNGNDKEDVKGGKNGKGKRNRGKGEDQGYNQKGGDPRKGGFSGGGYGAKGGNGGKGAKGDWSMKGKGSYWGYPTMAQHPSPMNAQEYSPEVQKQVLGERLYILVQSMVPTAAIAQKVTGMLLELPLPELMPVMEGGALTANGQHSELKTRVDEALEVLQCEGYRVER